MPAPTYNAHGRDELDPARPAAAIDIPSKLGTVVVPAPRVGSWHPDAADLEPDPSVLGAADPVIDTAAAAIEPPGPAKRGRGAVQGASSRRLSPSARRRLQLTQQALALRVQGLDMVAIGKALGVSAHTITGWFATHRRQVADGAIDQLLDEIAAPIAAENLVQGLLAGDKDYTLETLKGRGHLKRHTAGDVVPTGALPALSIVFEAPVAIGIGGQPTAIPQGKILGQISAPKTIDGTVVSDVGGADHDALDTVPVRVLSSGHDALSHTAHPPADRTGTPAPAVPRVPETLGIGQPTRPLEPGSAGSVAGAGRPVLP